MLADLADSAMLFVVRGLGVDGGGVVERGPTRVPYDGPPAALCGLLLVAAEAARGSPGRDSVAAMGSRDRRLEIHEGCERW